MSGLNNGTKMGSREREDRETNSVLTIMTDTTSINEAREADVDAVASEIKNIYVSKKTIAQGMDVRFLKN